MDGPEAVLDAAAASHAPWQVEVLLETNAEHAREQISPMLASLEEAESGMLLKCATPNLGRMARVSAGLFCPFVILKPPELQEVLKRYADEFSALSGRTEYRVSP